jgi:hypothetical protein
MVSTTHPMYIGMNAIQICQCSRTGVSRDGDKWMKLRVEASDGVQGGHMMYTGSGWMSLLPVLAAARVALHRSACSRGIQAGQERDSSQVSVYGCVQVLECVLSTLPLCGVVLPFCSLWSRVPPSPFIVRKRRGRVTIFGCTKIERECPKVLPIPSFPLSSCIRTIIVVVVAGRGCRWRGEAIPWAGCGGPWAIILSWWVVLAVKIGYPILLVPNSSPRAFGGISKFYSSRGLEMNKQFVSCSWRFFRWVRASAPVGCSPRGLGGVVYPFKGWDAIVELWATLAIR